MVVNPAWYRALNGTMLDETPTAPSTAATLISMSPAEYFSSGEWLRCKRCKNDVCFDMPGSEREEYKKRGNRCSSCYRQWLNGKIMKARGH